MIPRGKRKIRLGRKEGIPGRHTIHMKCHERNELLGQDVYDRSLKQSNILQSLFYRTKKHLT